MSRIWRDDEGRGCYDPYGPDDDEPGNEAGIDPAWADIDTLDERLRIVLTWVPGVRRDAALRTLDALTERAKQAVDREVSVRYCLNVHGDMLCNGPQGHEGGCVFEPGWMLARRIEDDCVSIAAYAGDTTNELRETRDEIERLTAALRKVDDSLSSLYAGPNAFGSYLQAAKLAVREALAGKETTRVCMVCGRGPVTVSVCDRCCE